MKRVFTVLFFTVVTVLSGFCDAAVIGKADALYREGKLHEGLQLLLQQLPSVTNAHHKSEMLWRCSRFTLRIGDKKRESGANKEEILALYD